MTHKSRGRENFLGNCQHFYFLHLNKKCNIVELLGRVFPCEFKYPTFLHFIVHLPVQTNLTNLSFGDRSDSYVDFFTVIAWIWWFCSVLCAIVRDQIRTDETVDLAIAENAKKRYIWHHVECIPLVCPKHAGFGHTRAYIKVTPYFTLRPSFER